MLKGWPAFTVSNSKIIGVLSVLQKSYYKNKELTSFSPPVMGNTTSCFIPQAFRDGMKVAHFVTICGKPVLMQSVTRAYHLVNDTLRSALDQGHVLGNANFRPRRPAYNFSVGNWFVQKCKIAMQEQPKSQVKTVLNSYFFAYSSTVMCITTFWQIWANKLILFSYNKLFFLFYSESAILFCPPHK